MADERAGRARRRGRGRGGRSTRPSAAPPRSCSTPAPTATLDAMRHSAAHVMAEAVLDLFPGTKLGIGPAIEDGFYYDFQLDRPLTPDDLAAIEARMAASVAADHPFVRRELPPDEGRAFFVERDQPFKVEILDDLAAKAKADGAPMPPVTRLRARPVRRPVQGPARREHRQDRAVQAARASPARTGAATRSGRCSSAIYGTVWPTQEELDQYLWRREEAKKRDHRRLGVQLDLFSFHDVSPGLGVLAPEGPDDLADARGRDARAPGPARLPGGLARRSSSTRSSGSSRATGTSTTTNMFKLEVGGPDVQPQADELPRVDVHLPLARSARTATCRCASTSTAGSTATSGRARCRGLTRVRQFIQDDAHIYVRPDQLADEIEAMLGEVREAYSWVGLKPRFAFATKPDKAIGDPALWERAEALIKEALDRAGGDYKVKPKDGTFYAPKIDIYIDDALGREWQMATIQVDLTMLPERFDLTLHRRGRPAAAPDRDPPRDLRLARAVHRHPRRALRRARSRSGSRRSRPSSSRSPTATSRRPTSWPACSRSRGLRVEVDGSDNRMQNKIRLAQEQKVPYMVVLGDREIEARTASPRTRAGEQQPPEPWEALAGSTRGGVSGAPRLSRKRADRHRQTTAAAA